MAAKKANKFDPEPKPEAWAPEECKDEVSDRSEALLTFIRRCLGTSEVAPFVIAGDVINGASIAALCGAFKDCNPVGKDGAPVPDGIASRRAQLAHPPSEPQ